MSDIQKIAGERKRLRDGDRAAYMIAWRDRYIQKMEEERAGYAEERALLHALLFFALFGKSTPCGGAGEDPQMKKAPPDLGGTSGNGVPCGEAPFSGARTVKIEKEAVRALLSAWGCRTTDAGDAYTVTFEPQEKTEA